MLFDIDLSNIKPRPKRRVQTCGHSHTRPRKRLVLPDMDLTGWKPPRKRGEVKIRIEP